MIICSHSNIDIIQGVIGYADAEGITDWRISNTNAGIFNILNSTSANARISILENGNVGFGTTNPSSMLDIVGDPNITGVYKKNNRDVINDTSNYVLSTSNILVPCILTEVENGSNYVSRLTTALNTRVDNTSNYVLSTSNLLVNSVSNSQWAKASSGIYYSPTITSSPSATITGTTGNYTYQVFTYTTETAGAGTGQTLYTINVSTGGVVCDILMVGGGGGGSGGIGGGGGAGGVVWIENTTLSSGTYTIRVGKGGTGGIANVGGGTAGIIGGNSSISNGSISITADRGGSPYSGLNNGGSGAGADGYNADGGLATAGGKIDKTSSPNSFLDGTVLYYGTNGGNKATTDYGGGGGGGAKNNTGVNGGNNIAGIGGEGLDIINGKDLKTHFNITDASIGHNINNKVYFGGGGGGSGGSPYSGTGQLGGLGGGGNGASGSGVRGTNAQQNTGGGGGAGSTGYGGGGDGGSGIVIIRYITSPNVGIGTTNPVSKLHIYDDTISNTKLTIQNNFTQTIAINSSPSATTSSNGNYTNMIFTYTTETGGGGSGQTLYTITVPAGGVVCDLLIVAGGGGGGMNAGAGGGAGGLILLQGTTLAAGTYTIRVGDGGAGGTTSATGTVASNGFNSTLGTNTAIAGGAGGNSGGANGNAGGSGGGAGNDTSGNRSGGAGTAGQGFKGGDGTIAGGATRTGGGGGGAGGEGQASVSTTRAGDGGIGRNLSTLFGTSVGQSGWFAGGGGGGVHSGTGGTGGTGGGGSENVVGSNGTGGGGGAARSDGSTGRKGGSGIVIIRYLTPSSSTIELLRGNSTYKISNYGGEFKIISSTSSVDTDYIRITSDGASIYNPTGSPQWSTVSDRRIKENIEKASYDKCYDNINKLELYRFNYIKELKNINKDLKQLGYIAQEVQDIFPKAVSSQEFHNDIFNFPDMLSIDIAQINYSLYGAVKKLIEIYNDIENNIKILENILEIDNTSSSNVIIDTTTSNIAIDNTTSNIAIDNTTSNIAIDNTTSNIAIDTTTSNVIIDTFMLI